MKPILERYKEKKIHINVSNPVKTEVMTLLLVGDDYFGVLDESTGMRAYFPFTAILGIYEGMNGILQININHFVLYKGSAGLGFSF